MQPDYETRYDETPDPLAEKLVKLLGTLVDAADDLEANAPADVQKPVAKLVAALDAASVAALAVRKILSEREPAGPSDRIKRFTMDEVADAAPDSRYTVNSPRGGAANTMQKSLPVPAHLWNQLLSAWSRHHHADA
jgi:hypothetical protein